MDVLVQVARSAAMFTARRKIQKEKGQEPDEFEESVAQVCLLRRPRNLHLLGIGGLWTEKLEFRQLLLLLQVILL